MATTENITVLFTDLVGSTELAAAISPGAADDLRRKHFSSLRQAIASSGGSEVKNLGDGLMVVFPVASAALLCAVAMQQVVHRDNADTERPLGLRVGVSAGEVTREAEDYFGEPVIEAARLCARANAGQIMISDLVRAQCRSEKLPRLLFAGSTRAQGIARARRHPRSRLGTGAGRRRRARRDPTTGPSFTPSDRRRDRPRW